MVEMTVRSQKGLIRAMRHVCDESLDMSHVSRKVVDGMDLRKERTLKSLSESMLGLMTEKRYKDITVAELCDRAMVRRATFYRHFSDKDDLLRFVVRSYRERIRQNVDPDGNLPLRDFCECMTGALLDFVDENQVLLRKVALSTELPFFVTLFAQEISSEFAKKLEGDCLNQGDSSGAIDLDVKRNLLLADFYIFGLLGSLEQVFLRGDDFDKEEVMASLLQIFDRLV